MFTVKVGELRNRLSAYLKRVRQGGEVLITDRETPIGRIIPYQADGGEEPFKMIEPPHGFSGLAKTKFPRRRRVNAVAELLADRQRR